MDIIIDRIVGPVAGGLIGGALLIVLLGLLYSKVFPNYPFAQTRFPDKTYFEMLKTTGELDEVKAFLAKYPAATTTVYANRIVEYHILGNNMSKYSDIRIELGQDNSIVFTQLRCLIVDRETNTVLDSFEHHGQRLLSIAEYLRDERCPN